MRSVCPACEKLNPAMRLYCQSCGGSLQGARLVGDAEQRVAEPQTEGLQQRDLGRWLKARWPLLVGLLLAVCLLGMVSFLLVQGLPRLAGMPADTAIPVGSPASLARTSEASRPIHTPRSVVVTPPTSTPSPMPTATATPRPSISVRTRREDDLEPVDVRFLKDPLGALHFVGEVQNNGDLAVEQVEVGLSLLDGDGAPLVAEAAAIPARLIPVGERSPFEVVVRDPPRNWASYRLQIGGQDADLTWQDRYAELEILEEAIDRPGFDDYRIDGLVKNPGPADARDVQVIATFYGNDGRVVAVASTPVEPSPLGAKKAAPFRIDVHAVPVPVVRYVLSVEGIRVD